MTILAGKEPFFGQDGRKVQPRIANAIRNQPITVSGRGEQPAESGDPQLGAQSADMDREAVGFGPGGEIPDVRDQHRGGHALARTLRQPPEQRELARMEPEPPPLDKPVARDQIEPQRTKPHHLPPQFEPLGDALRPRRDLGEVETGRTDFADSESKQPRALVTVCHPKQQ